MNYVHLRRFIDKMKSVDPSVTREFIMSAREAQGLHADISKLLTDLHELSTTTVAKQTSATETSVELNGGSF